VASGVLTADAVIVRSAPLDRWLAEAAGPSSHAPELIVALLPDASFGARVLQRLPADIPVLWLHATSEGVMPIDTVPDRPTGRLPVDATDTQLAAAVSALAHGLSVSFPAAIHPQHTVVPPGPAQELAEPLTARELEVLELMAKGLVVCFAIDRTQKRVFSRGRRAAMRRCNPCRAHLRLQAQTVPQADGMPSETPATPSR
jgi:hypothetical protein